MSNRSPSQALDRATIAARGVRAPAPETLPEGQRATPAAEPLYQTSVFHFPSVEAAEQPLAGTGGYVYARYGLPNARSLELTVAALEGAEDALATSSGMAAIGCTLLSLVGAGERVLCQDDAYGGTLALLRQDLTRLGVVVSEVPVGDLAAVERALAAGARALLVETLSNPLLQAAPLAALGERCRAHGTTLVVDNTFATPVFARPIEAGADLVVHSATKFLGGHHDLCAGIVAGRAALVSEARGVARRFGAVAAPFDAWLASRGLRTLAVRMERAQATARDLAERFRAQPAVAAVHYPGWGAMLSVDLGSADAAIRAVRALALVQLTPSLGGTSTGVSHPASSSHRALTAAERARIGLGDGLLRFSVGLESPDDLWRDLAGALATG